MVAATSAGRSDGFAATCARNAAVSADSAPGVAADTGTSTRSAADDSAATDGGSSKITCAFVPPTPSALTPARNTSPGHGSCILASVNGLPANRSSGFGAPRWTVGTRERCRSISATLINPAMPAQLSRCPTFGFTEPSAHPPAGAPSNASHSASNSTGSPSGVPVPCAST